MIASKPKNTYDDLLALIVSRMYINYRSTAPAKICESIDLSVTAIRARFLDPGKFTLAELQEICAVLGISADDIKAVLPF